MFGIRNAQTTHSIVMSPFLEVVIELSLAPIRVVSADLALELLVQSVLLVQPVGNRLAVPPDGQIQRVVDRLLLLLLFLLLLLTHLHALLVLHSLRVALDDLLLVEGLRVVHQVAHLHAQLSDEVFSLRNGTHLVERHVLLRVPLPLQQIERQRRAIAVHDRIESLGALSQISAASHPSPTHLPALRSHVLQHLLQLVCTQLLDALHRREVGNLLLHRHVVVVIDVVDVVRLGFPTRLCFGSPFLLLLLDLRLDVLSEVPAIDLPLLPLLRKLITLLLEQTSHVDQGLGAMVEVRQVVQESREVVQVSLRVTQRAHAHGRELRLHRNLLELRKDCEISHVIDTEHVRKIHVLLV